MRPGGPRGDAVVRGHATLSVIVPTLDEAPWLPRLAASLRAPSACQDRPDEVLVVDGGSTDGTPELARALGLELLSAPRGRGVQLARGAGAARGELLLFLHADARVEAGSLAAVRQAFADPRVVASGMRQHVEHPGLLFRAIERVADLRVRLGRVYGDSGLAVRSAAYHAVGGFRDLPLFEDLELSRRLRAYGAVRLVRGAVLHVSARRWLADGALRRTFGNWVLTLAFAAGVDPARLVRYYRPHAAAVEPP